jgi:hypothetical protein
MQKIKNIILTLAITLSPFVTVLFPVGASAAIENNVCHGATELSITTGASTEVCPDQTSKFDSIIRSILIFLSAVVGFVAVVMLIFGGFRYVTSGGNSESISKAKNTIIYALIGLVIVALAQIIVQFVLNKAVTGATPPPPPPAPSP